MCVQDDAATRSDNGFNLVITTPDVVVQKLLFGEDHDLSGDEIDGHVLISGCDTKKTDCIRVLYSFD